MFAEHVLSSTSDVCKKPYDIRMHGVWIKVKFMMIIVYNLKVYIAYTVIHAPKLAQYSYLYDVVKTQN